MTERKDAAEYSTQPRLKRSDSIDAFESFTTSGALNLRSGSMIGTPLGWGEKSRGISILSTSDVDCLEK